MECEKTHLRAKKNLTWMHWMFKWTYENKGRDLSGLTYQAIFEKNKWITWMDWVGKTYHTTKMFYLNALKCKGTFKSKNNHLQVVLIEVCEAIDYI